MDAKETVPVVDAETTADESKDAEIAAEDEAEGM